MRTLTNFLLIDEQNNKVLLGMKKRGFGAGKYNGFGGKVESKESIKQAAIRELFEEAGLTVNENDVTKQAELTFKAPFDNSIVHVFTATKWTGEPVESEEMAPKWFEFNEIPYDTMWADDKHWIPIVLAGKYAEGSFTFDKDENIIDMNIQGTLKKS
ncbi:DNA mismatch repair protein MutT [Candidatus Woesearchaeota archaeon CG10_big_fil_rev_8_21_14_0_10_37_12]|nr:MAG: DNA mismatch repair protein MutT [Candidatus Woesearchaeota archaeon CG10_big_fil_rev_8_21_14_0_10_37_12]